MRLPIRSIILAAAVSLVVSGPARATIVGGAANNGFLQLTVPFTESNPDNTVGADTFDTPLLYAFNEDQNIVIDRFLSVDVGTPLAIGTEVASHYVCFDPISNRTIGYVEFDANILAIMTTTNNLAASDFLANTGVHYLNPDARGLEPGDFATIDVNNPKRVLIDFSASSPGDYIRVLTAHSPAAVPPDVSGAKPTVGSLWPPNHKFVGIAIAGVTDPAGRPVQITIVSVRQDEPTATTGGPVGPDAVLKGATVDLRAERAGDADGRVYHVTFVANNGDAQATGTVSVQVPHDIKGTAVDGGALYDSTQP
jgi:hypothetical protein